MERPRCATTMFCLALLAAGAAAGQQGAGAPSQPDTAASQTATTPDKPSAAADQQTATPPPAPATAWNVGPVAVSGLVDGYYSLGFNHPANNISSLRAFDDRTNQ